MNFCPAWRGRNETENPVVFTATTGIGIVTGVEEKGSMVRVKGMSISLILLEKLMAMGEHCTTSVTVKFNHRFCSCPRTRFENKWSRSTTLRKQNITDQRSVRDDTGFELHVG
jgi:hypothetical protein